MSDTFRCSKGSKCSNRKILMGIHYIVAAGFGLVHKPKLKFIYRLPGSYRHTVKLFCIICGKNIKYLITICNSLFFLKVTFGCGTTTSENCTYLEASKLSSGNCRMQVCKCSSDICQVCIFCRKLNCLNC
jgi:hypothetical protein